MLGNDAGRFVLSDIHQTNLRLRTKILRIFSENDVKLHEIFI